MLKSISIKNFRTFKDIELEVTNLNILTGLNDSGKSNFLQAFLIFEEMFDYAAVRKQTKLKFNFVDSTFEFNAKEFNYFYDMLYLKDEFSITLSNKLNNRLIILKNPETHSHPKQQSEIGLQFAEIVKIYNSQIFIETHSDHIINAIRVAVKEKVITPEQVRIFYFDKVDDNNGICVYSFVHVINIDEDGRIDNWPDGFLDEWDKNLTKIL